jgi:putative membrane protein
MRIVMMVLSTLLAVPAFAQMAPVGPGATPPSSGGGNAKLDSNDAAFVQSAAQASRAEVELGRLAVQKASNPDVRKLGQRMIDDHTKQLDQLQQIATRGGFTLPSGLSPEQQAARTRLSSLSGSEFDTAFVDELKKDHQQAITLYQDEAKNGVDPQLKSFAQSGLPELRHHEQMVNRTSQKL